MSSWSRTQAVFIKFKTVLFLIESFVQLKINNQALETAFATVSPGRVFKVFGSDKSIKHNRHNFYFLYFCDLIMAALIIMQNQNRVSAISIQYMVYIFYNCSHFPKICLFEAKKIIAYMCLCAPHSELLLCTTGRIIKYVYS